MWVPFRQLQSRMVVLCLSLCFSLFHGGLLWPNIAAATIQQISVKRGIVIVLESQHQEALFWKCISLSVESWNGVYMEYEEHNNFLNRYWNMSHSSSLVFYRKVSLLLQQKRWRKPCLKVLRLLWDYRKTHLKDLSTVEYNYGIRGQILISCK